MRNGMAHLLLMRRGGELLCSRLILLLLLVLGVSPAGAETEPDIEPRVVLAFYDGERNKSPLWTQVHQSAEMPLNHLGIDVHYHDLHQPLPDEGVMRNVRGILLWLDLDSMPNPEIFLNWIIGRMETGLPVVVMGPHSFEYRSDGSAVDPALVGRFWRQMGLKKTGEWITATYALDFQRKDGGRMTAFEHDLPLLPSAIPDVRIIDADSVSYLRAYDARSVENALDLVVTGKHGGYIAPGYSIVEYRDSRRRYWYINPFRFFSEAFRLEGLPKPDTTTLSGRRIFYSHIDGDGWRNPSLVPGYRDKGKLSSEVIYQEIFLKYPDLPVTVGPIAADLDLNWFGTKESRRIAREIFALPHIEAGSHTYTHPLSWQFFKHYDTAKEAPYLPLYPKTPGNFLYQAGLQGLLKYAMESAGAPPDSERAAVEITKVKGDIEDYYRTPRVYYNGPYDLQTDIVGSADLIEQFLPEGKKVQVLQWSGNTTPFERAVALAREAGMKNINGGDTRLDRQYNSLLWVSPIGRRVGKELQIFASNSNENTYTDLWTGRFYGYRFLEQALRRTESPWRIKPINIYYHMYSGEREASLNALRRNLDYARSQSIAPVTTSLFAAIAEGFFSARIERLEGRRWRILDRGRLQTVRFDRAAFRGVDFERSEGVLGQTHLQGSLYIHLDPAEEAPVVALREVESADREPDASRPYLISSRWWTEGLAFSSDRFRFQVQGYGAGDMQWYVPIPGRYRLRLQHADGKVEERESEVTDEHWLNISLRDAPIQPVQVEVDRIEDDDGRP